MMKSIYSTGLNINVTPSGFVMTILISTIIIVPLRGYTCYLEMLNRIF